MKRASQSNRTLDLSDSKTIALTHDDDASWLCVARLPQIMMPTEEMIAEIWQLRPAEHSKIKIFGKDIEVPRYDQAFGRAYNFSGVNHEATPLPALLQKYMDFANQACATILERDYDGCQFNMLFCNWYMDGNHYIGWHSDDETQLYKNRHGETLVFSISLGQQRRFLLKHRTIKAKPLTVDLAHGDCVLMAGRCQRNYKHSVPKEPKKAMGRRFNMTFRIFKPVEQKSTI